jgi:hypothetical protein
VDQDLKVHFVRSLTVSDAERGAEVAGEVFLVLDGGQNWLVNRLLIRSTF